MANTEKKVTYAEALNYVLTMGVDLPTEIREKIEMAKASYEKKRTTDSKPTKAQLENERIKDAIVVEMLEGEKYTVTELIKNLPSLKELSNQKVSALMRQLETEKRVVKSEDKRKSVYSLA